MIIGFIIKLFSNIPPITRLFIFGMFLTGLLIKLEICDATYYYFDLDLIIRRNEWWRLFTCILFHGEFSIFLIINAYLFYQYSAGLENNSFRTKSEDYFYMMFLIYLILLSILIMENYYGLVYFSYNFGRRSISSCLIEIVIYLWARNNHRQQVFIFFVLAIRASYLPYIFILFGLVHRGGILNELLGIFIGHVLYYFYFVVPKLPQTHGMNILKAPWFVKPIIGWIGLDLNRELQLEDGDFVEDDNAIPNFM